MITPKEIERLFKRKFLQEEEIVEITKMTTGDIFQMMKHNKNYKQQILISIYWNPTLLYNCKNLSEQFIENLISFVEYRYNIEKNEMEDRLLEGYVSKEEYEKYLNELEAYFFPSDSHISKNIKRIIFSKKDKTYKL